MARDTFRSNIDLHCEEEERTLLFGEIESCDAIELMELLETAPHLFGHVHVSQCGENSFVRVLEPEDDEECLAQA
jgi:hypothetical protein